MSRYRSDGPLDIRMLVEVVPSTYGDPYFHIVARPVKWYFSDYESDRGWRTDGGFAYDDPHYSDLQVRAQGDLSSSEPAYGWNVEYHERYSVRLSDAEQMVKVLRKVERGLEKLNAELTYTDTIGAYIARVAKILGISQFGFFPPKGEQMWASGERIRWDNASHLEWQIQQRVTEIREARAH